MKKMALLLSLFLSVGCVFSQGASYSIDAALTQTSYLKPNSIVVTNTYKNQENQSTFKIARKYIGMTKDGYYLVQDLYAGSHKEYTKPYKTNETGIKSTAAAPKEGGFILLYENGTPKAELNYHKGKLNGSAKLFNKNGVARIDSTFEDGIAIGKAKGVNEDGSVFIDLNIVHNTTTSIIDLSPNDEGGISFSGDVKFNLDNIERLFSYNAWYSAGVKMAEVDALSNKKNKVAKFWHKNGKLMMEVIAEPGLKSLSMRSFYEDGTIMSEGIASSDGDYLQSMWTEEGKKIYEQYTPGEKNNDKRGYIKSWDKDGKETIKWELPESNLSGK